MPLAWQIIPRTGVSYNAHSSYGPSRVITGSGMPRGVFGGKTLPSGRAHRLTAFPSKRCTTSSRPQKIPHGQLFGKAPVVTSATTLARLRPAFFRMSRVRTK